MVVPLVSGDCHEVAKSVLDGPLQASGWLDRAVKPRENLWSGSEPLFMRDSFAAVYEMYDVLEVFGALDFDVNKAGDATVDVHVSAVQGVQPSDEDSVSAVLESGMGMRTRPWVS